MLRIAIVIPTFNRPELITRLLESLQAAQIPASLTEIWVVENGSRRGTEAVCDKFRPVLPIRYAFELRPGPSHARNLGTKNADADVVIYFDDDIRCDPKTLLAYDREIQSHGDRAFYGGQLGIDYEEKPEDWMMQYLPSSVKGFNLGTQPCFISEPMFLGANHAIPKTIQVELGGFDGACPVGQSGPMGEETRLQKRLLGRGLAARYIPDALVWHYVPAERSSFKWALIRKYRQAYSHGLTSDSNKDVKKVFGLPRWLVAKVLRLGFIVSIASLNPLQDKKQRFVKRWELMGALGELQGYRARK